MNTKHLNKAKKVKNDEFYTQISDIEKELPYYKEQFENKVVYCNCDSEFSNFWLYFKENFNNLKLKKLIITHKHGNYKIELTKKGIVKSKLSQNGDFRSPDCIALLNKADIICTNPPFSLLIEYIDLLVKYNKKFLIIFPFLSYTNKNIFNLIKNDKIWLGNNYPNTFLTPDLTKVKVLTAWLNNIKKVDKTNVRKEYCSYYIYDNYNAINVDKIKDIPNNYNGLIGVPVTFLKCYNKEKYEIVDAISPIIGNKKLFKRLIIRKKEV
ncbi:MAG: hypothetical protein EVJ48_01965 [Candidatus Acidulodesulfobacterium acidiphilum]|uniref:Modification methylase n=1 Tax=Candidatus Acidulodesulfobacterium acidiphilum TaxID=2597224 RepID=A0A520XGR4_9DELT|nr:MAG: hypothetical protein EVJ48_01965 [Candidatus Acidulodesulfobacterium acidiphilum]